MNRFKIGTRVFAGFILILVLLGVVALIATLGLSSAGGSFKPSRGSATTRCACWRSTAISWISAIT